MYVNTVPQIGWSSIPFMRSLNRFKLFDHCFQLDCIWMIAVTKYNLVNFDSMPLFHQPQNQSIYFRLINLNPVELDVMNRMIAWSTVWHCISLVKKVMAISTPTYFEFVHRFCSHHTLQVA